MFRSPIRGESESPIHCDFQTNSWCRTTAVGLTRHLTQKQKSKYVFPEIPAIFLWRQQSSVLYLYFPETKRHQLFREDKHFILTVSQTLLVSENRMFSVMPDIYIKMGFPLNVFTKPHLNVVKLHRKDMVWWQHSLKCMFPFVRILGLRLLHMLL